jgi:hypothetical protein
MEVGQPSKEIRMNIAPVGKLARTGLLLGFLASCGAMGGCAYSGIASTPDGTIVLARNSMLGANRKIFVCKVVNDALKCVESAGAP